MAATLLVAQTSDKRNRMIDGGYGMVVIVWYGTPTPRVERVIVHAWIAGHVQNTYY
jgi:hypothetical protein